LLADHAERLGVPVVFGSVSMMERGRIALDRTSLVAGTVPFVLHALRHLGVPAPEHIPYPEVLNRWLFRRIAKYHRLRDALNEIHDTATPMFVKPAKGWKRFTGFVARFPDDVRFNGASRSAPVWVSEPIALASEWRAYVAHGSILSVTFVDQSGDRHASPDSDVIRDAVTALVESGAAPAGFAIDFGVDVAGQTMLVEVNDGFSIGAYDDLDAESYWTVTDARWRQLMVIA